MEDKSKNKIPYISNSELSKKFDRITINQGPIV